MILAENRDIGPHDISSTYLRLGSDASVEPLLVGDDFWKTLVAGALGSFHNEYLVSSHCFDSDWTVWEVHPNGDEIVILLDGAVEFVLEQQSGPRRIELKENGAFVIVPKGTWHTARVDRPCRMLFIAAGEGTQHREAT